jgi:hypothetical protein
MIDFKTFKEIIAVIKKHERWKNRCSHFLENNVCTDTWAIVSAGDELENALIKLLEKIFNDKGKWIDWWLFEDVEKVAFMPDNSERKISNLKKFYEFLLDNKDENDEEDARF